MKPPLVDVRELAIAFPAGNAVDGIDLHIEQGEAVGLVGESGCGKTLTALSLLGLVPEPGRVRAQRLRVAGCDLLAATERDLHQVRGGQVAMVFQDPVAALNPVIPVGHQVAEVLQLHGGMDRHSARREAIATLGRVGLSDPERQSRAYPSELSGGMCQRVVIAQALAGTPQLLVADEPTTALDVTIQKQILDLLAELRAETQLATLMISHDLNLVASHTERVLVMDQGLVVESAASEKLFTSPCHPYTSGLLDCLPSRHRPGERLTEIPAAPRRPQQRPSGCRFRERCPHAKERCTSEEPVLRELGKGHWGACHFPLDRESSS